MKTILVAISIAGDQALSENDVDICVRAHYGSYSNITVSKVDLTADDCEWAASATDSDKRFDQGMAAHLRKAAAQIRGAE